MDLLIPASINDAGIVIRFAGACETERERDRVCSQSRHNYGVGFGTLCSAHRSCAPRLVVVAASIRTSIRIRPTSLSTSSFRGRWQQIYVQYVDWLCEKKEEKKTSVRAVTLPLHARNTTQRHVNMWWKNHHTRTHERTNARSQIRTHVSQCRRHTRNRILFGAADVVAVNFLLRGAVVVVVADVAMVVAVR